MPLKDKRHRAEPFEENGHGETKKKTQYTTDEERLLKLLADLGGQRVSNDTLAFEGKRFVIPATMTTGDAIEFLKEWRESQEEYHAFQRTFNFKPWDGAYAVQATLQKLFGTAGIGKPTFSFFGGKEPPQQRTINIGVNETTQVPWGVVAVPMLGDEASIRFAADHHDHYGLIFAIVVNAQKKHKATVEGLFRAIEEQLSEHSIYRGKAIDGNSDPSFIDLNGVDPAKVIYSEDVNDQLEANVWSLLRHTDTMRRMELPLKRSVLLEGPYGTGKTLALFLTGQIAVDNGWTFLYCRPGEDDLFEVMGTARLYQPAIVCFEDVDNVSSGREGDNVSQLLDVFDGITAKGTELLAVMTTNHPERIHKGMVRPGRLDAVIHIGALDASGIQRMIEECIPQHKRPHLDYGEIAIAMEGYLPAFTKEAIDRTVRYAIARSGGEPGVLSTDDFVLAANGLRSQLELMEGAKEGAPADPISTNLRRMMRSEINQTSLVTDDDDIIGTLTEK